MSSIMMCKGGSMTLHMHWNASESVLQSALSAFWVWVHTILQYIGYEGKCKHNKCSTVLTFRWLGIGRPGWEWAFWNCAFGAGTMSRGSPGQPRAPLARLLLQSETSFPYWSPASLRPLSHRSARFLSSPLIGQDLTRLVRPTNHGWQHILGDFIISQLGWYPKEKRRLGTVIQSGR